MIRAILVDDEPKAIKSLKWELEQFCPEVEVVATYTNPLDAIIGIGKLRPECVFLDIEMPEMDGFQLLSKLDYHDFDLLITTAYDSYALKAFKEDAIGYLLKPIDTDDLRKAVKKVLKNKEKNDLGVQLRMMFGGMINAPSTKKIALPMGGKVMFLNEEEILYCKADGNYTTVFKTDESSLLISKKIKDIEALLPENVFFRVHQSFVVNLECVKEYVKNEGHYLVLAGGATIPVSRSKKNELQEILQSI